MDKHIKAVAAQIIIFALVLSACGSMTPAVYTPLPTYTSTATRTTVPTFVLHATFTPTPSSTPSPTGTVSPTWTITPTLIPGALDCNMINSKQANGMTDLQWAEYSKTVVGKAGYFSGTVDNVKVNGIVELVAGNQQCVFELSNIPIARAIKINKDQYMEGYGAISAIDNADILVIHLNVLIDSLIVH